MACSCCSPAPGRCDGCPDAPAGEHLDAHQLAAVESPAERLLILAGPGTGKTRVLVARALRQAETHDRVRLLTYTRRAARVLRERLQASGCPGRLLERIEVDTHHGLAAALLHRHGQQIGLWSTWSVVDQVEEKRLAGEADHLRTSLTVRKAQGHLLGYGDLLPAALRLLKEHPEVAETEGGSHTALLVDEAHDSSAEEWALDERMRPGSVTAVGDAAQRIYGWRGAADISQAWLALVLQQRGTVAELPRNYRSVAPIVELANHLPVAGRVQLVADRPAPRPVVIPAVELESWMPGERGGLRPTPPGDWAVLARRHDQLAHVEQELRAAGIPYHWPAGGAKAWETPAARHLLAYLHVIVDPHDSIHLGRILEAEGWSFGALLQANIGRAEQACSLWDWACAHVDPASRQAELLRLLALLRGQSSQAAAHQLIALGHVGHSAPALPPDLSPAEALAWVADPDRDEPQGEGEGVYLGTIHSAKGAEWPAVVVVGLEEGGLPLGRRRGERRAEEERIEEERRLLYVAITRARDRLVLARRPDTTPSRFLAELGFAEVPR